MRSVLLRFVCLAALAVSAVGLLRADDGYRLWLRYDRITDDADRATGLPIEAPKAPLEGA